MTIKPTPLKLSTAEKQAVLGQLNTQEVQRATKSKDPNNFPVFEIPVGKRVYIYVPNHVVEGKEEPELRMDKPLIHTIKDGKRFHSFRCVSGISLKTEDGTVIFDGSCPICDSTDIPWDLARLKIKQKCKQLGLDPDDTDNPQVKAIRSGEFSDRVIKESQRYYTFPIVVFKTVNDDGKTIEKDEAGNPVLNIMWYHISESSYKSKWLPTLEGMEDEPTHPGGHFFILNYVYDTKNKEANKRDAARNFSVIAKNPKGAAKMRTYLDSLTEEWTPEKAQETVISNLLYPMDELQKVADSVLEQSKDMLALLQAAEAVGNETKDSNGFNLKATNDDSKALESKAGISEMDETDEDVDFG